MKKVNIETVKTILIAVLVTGMLAFIGGMRYQAHVNGQVKTEAKNIAMSLKQ